MLRPCLGMTLAFSGIILMLVLEYRHIVTQGQEFSFAKCLYNNFILRVGKGFKIHTLISKRLSIENKAKLSRQGVVNK